MEQCGHSEGAKTFDRWSLGRGVGAGGGGGDGGATGTCCPRLAQRKSSSLPAFVSGPSDPFLLPSLSRLYVMSLVTLVLCYHVCCFHICKPQEITLNMTLFVVYLKRNSTQIVKSNISYSPLCVSDDVFFIFY